MKKIFIIAGEASGDLHGSNLCKEILNSAPETKISGWGGSLMESQGVTILKHYNSLAFMGFSEVLKNIGTIMKNFALCKRQIQDFQPDLILFIDYPGFNLRMAKWAKEQGYTTIYYISPQIWAWKENRIHTIRKYIDQMIVILPFEKAFYEKWNYPVSYVGHPLVKVIEAFKASHTNETASKKIIALLPGSRKQEIKAKLPTMLLMAKHFSAYTFIVAKAPGIEDGYYNDFLKGYENVTSKSGSTYAILSSAHAALVTSGTATLETALFKVPEVVCYKGNKLSYLIAKRLIKIKYISLVNLIMDQLVVKELIQDLFNEKELKNALEEILEGSTRDKMLVQYDALIALLSEDGDASEKAAAIVVKMLTTTS